MDPFVLDNLLNLWLLAKTSTVLIARTESAGQSTGVWSEARRGFQPVNVVVEEVISGKPPEEPKLQLSLPLVKGTRIAASTPAIVGWIVTPGSRVVYFLKDGKLVDEDLGAFQASPELVKFIKDLCNGPLPPSTGSVLYQLSQLAKDDPDVKAAFADLKPAVMDIVEDEKKTVRMTVVNGVIRVFTGIRLKRVVKSREPDITVFADAETLAKVLTGKLPFRDLRTKGDAPELLAAMETATKRIAKNPDHVALIESAAGPRK